jgi:hypothetical protein
VNVLFLALGASRWRAVVEECGQIVGDGGTATVVFDSTPSRQRARLPDGVTPIDVAKLERARGPMRVEHLLVYRGPRFVLRRLLRSRAEPVVRAHRKVADRFHRRIFLPVYRPFQGESRARLIAREVSRNPRPYDWIIVADSRSMPDAVRLLDGLGSGRPGVAYSIDHLPAGAAA